MKKKETTYIFKVALSTTKKLIKSQEGKIQVLEKENVELNEEIIKLKKINESFLVISNKLDNIISSRKGLHDKTGLGYTTHNYFFRLQCVE